MQIREQLLKTNAEKDERTSWDVKCKSLFTYLNQKMIFFGCNYLINYNRKRLYYLKVCIHGLHNHYTISKNNKVNLLKKERKKSNFKSCFQYIFKQMIIFSLNLFSRLYVGLMNTMFRYKMYKHYGVYIHTIKCSVTMLII